MRCADATGLAGAEIAKAVVLPVVAIPMEAAAREIAGIQKRIIEIGHIDLSALPDRLGVELLDRLAGLPVPGGLRGGLGIADIGQRLAGLAGAATFRGKP